LKTNPYSFATKRPIALYGPVTTPVVRLTRCWCVREYEYRHGICPNCVTGNTYDIRVANLDSADDIDVGEMNGLLEADV